MCSWKGYNYKPSINKHLLLLLLVRLLRSKAMLMSSPVLRTKLAFLTKVSGHRSPQPLPEVHSFWPSLTPVLVRWAVLENVFRGLDAGTTRALGSV